MQSLQNFLTERSNLTKVLGIGALSLGALVCSGLVISKYTQDELSDSSPRKKRMTNNTQEPPGLKNYGNTCFINCILQALAGLPFFMNFIRKLCEMRMEDSRLETQIPELLLETLEYLNDHEQETLYPGRLIEAVRDKVDFKFYQEQQDCHEFLKLLMDIIDSTLKEKTQDLSRSINPIKTLTDEQELELTNPFNGYQAQVLVCDRCGQESNIKIECFNDLSLIIKESHITDMTSVFDHYFHPETVEDVECMGCSVVALIKKKKQVIDTVDCLDIPTEQKCKYILDVQEQIEYLRKVQKMSLEHKELNSTLDRILKKQLEKYNNDPKAPDILRCSFLKVKSRMKKCLRLARLPKVLCINLQRLTFNRFGDLVKVSKHIQFDDELSLESWLDLKLFSEDTAKSKYRLSAVIRHLGTESFGHYVTYRRVYKQSENSEEKQEAKPTNDDDSYWTYASDENTYVVKLREVLSSPAYMLFYEKI